MSVIKILSAIFYFLILIKTTVGFITDECLGSLDNPEIFRHSYICVIIWYQACMLATDLGKVHLFSEINGTNIYWFGNLNNLRNFVNGYYQAKLSYIHLKYLKNVFG